MTKPSEIDQSLSRARLRSQRLDPKPDGTVGDTVKGSGGIQAQEIAAAFWSIGTRAVGLTAADVNRAWGEERSIVLTWAMRGTRHFVATEDLGWILPLIAPRVIRGGRARNRELGLVEATFERATPLIEAFLAERGPGTRGEIGAMLRGEGIDTAGQRLIHLIARGALEGALCFGPGRDGEDTWVALEKWVPVAWEGERSDKLAQRYLAAFAPATAEDFAAWSGLPLAEARRGFEGITDECAQSRSEQGVLWQPRGAPKGPAGRRDATARLLPRYDTCLMGYRSREWLVPAAHTKRIHPGGGTLRATLLLDEQVAGTWTATTGSDGRRITVRPFEPLTAAAADAIEVEGAAMARFWGEPFAGIEIVTP